MSTQHSGEKEALRDKIANVLRTEGGEPGSSLHSWRCEHPDIYGACDCLEQVATEVIRSIAPEVATSKAEAQTAAWDEGHRAGCVYFPDCIELGHHDPNPHRVTRPTETGETDA